tara:strand:+ start:544 stop:696 length:153 start_codon:yes stop_codon:yes gene_type:complete
MKREKKKLLHNIEFLVRVGVEPEVIRNAIEEYITKYGLDKKIERLYDRNI